ncbi:MAG: ABC transporter ATP-binding protein, partial [Microbacterium gubbeenense]
QDRARADELLRLLEELRQDGTTILIVTHDLDLVAARSTHTIVLDRGRVHAAGPTEEIFADARILEDAGLHLPELMRVLPADLRALASEARR